MIHSSATFLIPLLFQVADQPDFQTTHCFATKTGAQLPFTNRVGNKLPLANSEEIKQIKQFFDTVPFAWFVDATDKQTISSLEKQSFKRTATYPAMLLDIAHSTPLAYAQGIAIKEIKEPKDINIWIDIITQSYGITKIEEFTHFIQALIKHAAPNVLHFYLASYNGVPAAGSMTIAYQDIVAVHWVGTLDSYRRKGVGYAITHKPLLDAQQTGAKKAVLFTSTMGEPVYQRLGFTTYAIYHVYQP